MSEQTRESIVGRLKREALKDPETGWLSDLARRGLAWEEREEVIVIGKDWFGSVDIGHLAGIVEIIAERHAKELAEKLAQSERARDALRIQRNEYRAEAKELKHESANLFVDLAEGASRRHIRLIKFLTHRINQLRSSHKSLKRENTLLRARLRATQTNQTNQEN